MNPLIQLQNLLRDLFQLSLADLDFGIYRLLRLKRHEVEAFLAEQLPRRVNDAFEAVAGEERADLEDVVAELAARIRDEIAEDALLPDGTVKPEYGEMKAKAARDLIAAYEAKRRQLQAVQASDAQQAEVFNHLYAFFSRYYEAGDFVPRRRYGAREAYAVPYNGEETFFHWANKDQHYVKTGEAFRDYGFAVDTLEGPRRVRFVLTAASLPPGNTKGDTRYFFPLPEEAAWGGEPLTFRLPFHYRLPTDKEAEKYGKNSRFQEGVLAASLRDILKAIPDTPLATALSVAVEEKEGEPISLLLKRLRHFTRRNTTDYFIHRDLEGFLKRELELYLKDRVLHLADLDGDLETKRRTLRVIRQIADEIITFLVQVEDVQKRLFEKRKFVLRTDYLVPIRHVPRDLWKEVLANEAQLAAWKALFAIEPREDLFNREGRANEQLLAEHPTLVVDTTHFGQVFKHHLLGAFDDLDGVTDGWLIHAENYQALRLLEHKYVGKVKCVYIDPPYNTGSDGFVYKDRYQHSSWLAMLRERGVVAMELLETTGLFLSSIDDNEIHHLRRLCDDMFGTESFVGTLTWTATTQPDNIGRARFGLQQNIEYILMYSKCGRLALPPFVLKSSSNVRKYPHQGRFGPCRFEIIERSFEGAYARPTMQFTILGRKPRKGKQWQIGEETARQLEAAGKVEIVNGVVKRAVYPEDDEQAEVTFTPFWAHLANAGTSQAGKAELTAILGRGHGLDTVKPVSLLRELFSHVPLTRNDDMLLDFFAGSGTTGHAVISLNRSDGQHRKFILVEMADYFDTVLIPRIQKVIYAPEWQDGMPKRLPTKEETERTPRLVKILRLESYEDALVNLTTDETLGRATPRASAHRDRLGPDAYRLRYLARLPLETSASMLNLAALEHPFRYTIEVLTEDAPRTETVDLVETFNLLHGLHVERLETWTNDKDGRFYRVVKGRNRTGQRVLVLWRDIENLDPVVERRFLEDRIKAEGPFDEVLINGDTATPGVRSLDGLFKRLMDDGES